MPRCHAGRTFLPDLRFVQSDGLDRRISPIHHGDRSSEYLMTYLRDGLARYAGQGRLTGRIGDREGTFVLHDSGAYVGGNTAQGALVILPGSGTGELQGLT